MKRRIFSAAAAALLLLSACGAPVPSGPDFTADLALTGVEVTATERATADIFNNQQVSDRGRVIGRSLAARTDRALRQALPPVFTGTNATRVTAELTAIQIAAPGFNVLGVSSSLVGTASIVSPEGTVLRTVPVSVERVPARGGGLFIVVAAAANAADTPESIMDDLAARFAAEAARLLSAP
ncbi:MAG: hypothetical protein ACU0DW_07620 [Shimia sp.]